MKTLSREGIQRMIDGQGASSGGGGGIQSLAGYATLAWTEENYLSKPYFNQLFTVHTQTTTTVVDDQGEPVGDPVITYGTLAPNALPGTTETTDEETGYVTTVATVITSIEAKFGFWSQSFISALGQGSGGGGGGASALTDLVDVAISNPTDGQALVYNANTGKWVNSSIQGGSTAWGDITNKPTTIAGYGITDAYTKTEADGLYLKLSGGTMSNTNVVTNMNADLLDGQHLNYIIREDQSFDFSSESPISGYIIYAGINSINPPSNICGGNQYTVIQVLPSSGTWGSQLAIGFGTSYLAWRNRQGTTTWGDWQKIKAGYADSAGSAPASDVYAWAKASTKPSYSFSELTSHPTTLSGYGITDAYINSGTIYLGGNSITPLTSFTETDPTVPAWAKAATKPSYAFSELTSHPTTLAGYGITDAYTKTEADGKFLTIAFFRSLFKAYTSANAEVVPNSGDTTTITSIKAMFGFWTAQYISALGQNSSGGGGGASSLTDLVDVAISNPTDGQALVYNTNTGKWVNSSIQGGSTAWSDITNKPTTVAGYGITDAYTKTEADGRYLKLSGGTMSNTNVVTNMNADLLDGQHLNYIIREDQSFDFSSESPISGYIIHAGINSINPPSNICGGNQYTVIQVLPSSGTWGSQLAIGFGTSYLAWRNRQGTTTWGDWQKIKAGYADSAGSAPASDVYAWAKAATKPSYTFSELTSHPTTLGGYGITDAYINSGTIYLGGNSITPLTSFTETDPTVPAWAKASTKPSYSFSELTGSVAFSQLPTMYWADVAVSSSSNNNTSPQFGNLRLRPGSSNYGSYLRFGDGDYAYIAELSDDQLTYRAGSHTFNVSSNEAVQINSSGLRIGGSSGVVLSWDSTNNALKVQKADGTAANLYATGGVSALGLSSGSGGSIGNLRVTGTLNIGSSYASLYCNSNNYLYVDAPRIYFDSTLYMGSNNIRTESGDIYTEEGNIYLGGGRLYLDSSRYIYLDGTTLKFYDGSTAKTIYTY